MKRTRTVIHQFIVRAALMYAVAFLCTTEAGAESGRGKNPPAFNSDRQATIVETVTADSPSDNRSGREHRSLSVFGFRMQGAGGYNRRLPFWVHSNRFGELYPQSNNAILHLFGAWQREFQSGISLTTGAGLLLRDAGERASQFQEAYVQVGYGQFVLWAGRKREYFGMVHPELSMGSADMSQNARPIPKITLSTDGFRQVPGTRGIVDYDVSLSHGWLRDDEHRFVERPFLHQKHLYLRLFNDRSRVVPQGGIKHFAQWGGESPIDGPVPSGPRAFLDVFFSLSPDSREILGGGRLENKYQNHVGTYDFSLLFRFERVRFSVSRQFFLEDTPNARFGTPWDGMWGAWVEFTGSSRVSVNQDSHGDLRNSRCRAAHGEITALTVRCPATVNVLPCDPSCVPLRSGPSTTSTSTPLRAWTAIRTVTAPPISIITTTPDTAAAGPTADGLSVIRFS
jgi:hypothetical protein